MEKTIRDVHVLPDTWEKKKEKGKKNGGSYILLSRGFCVTE